MNAVAPEKKEPKRKQNAIAIRRKILNSSRELFSEVGYQGATITRIREKADVSIATFYNYFDSKQSVLLALLEDERETYEGSIKSALEAAVHDPIIYMTSVAEALLDPPNDSKLKMLWREAIAATIVLSADPQAGPQISSDSEFYLRQLECAFDHLERHGLLKVAAPTKTLLSIVECIVAYGFQNYVCERYANRESFIAHIRQQLADLLGPWLATESV
ncbi:TetR/AcrR family transcriptional regulator [Agrobacterium rhizogenes]|nr:TetR/AcrR family transcriptional regulator [Rhizobium rhizogenes]NTH66702.1 TetR/AcrR family transcriptional regulator [Rhizobium rhizogenes]